MTDLRCGGNKLHGRLEAAAIEVKCSSRWCGAEPGVVVIHKFSASTGALIDTEVYKDPSKNRSNHAPAHGTAVRSA